MSKIKYYFLFGGILLIISGLTLFFTTTNNTKYETKNNKEQTQEQIEDEKQEEKEEQIEDEKPNETGDKEETENEGENEEKPEQEEPKEEEKNEPQPETPAPPPAPKEPVIPDGNLIEAYFLNSINNANFKITESYENNDAFIFKTYNNKYVLLDTGVTYSSANVPATEIIDLIYNKLKTLQNKDVVTIDYMIISHMHWDHAGNAPTILEDSRFDIKNTIFKREKLQPLDEKIYASAVKNGKTNIIESNNKLQEGATYTLDDNIKMYLFNVKDVFASATNCISGMSYFNFLIDEFRDKLAVRDGLLAGKKDYVYFYGLDAINNERNIIFKTRTDKPTRDEIKTDNYFNNLFWVVRQTNGYNCNANTNSIVVVFQIKTQKGNRYIYLPGDLENNGYNPFGEYDSKYNTYIHGGIATYPFRYDESTDGYSYAVFNNDKQLTVDTRVTLYKIPAEYSVAKQVTDIFGDMKGNITIYQESHHGLNNSPEALEVLGVNNKSTYSITPTGTNPQTSYQYRVLRGQYYLNKSNIMYTGESNRQGIKCTINGLGTTSCNKY